jgi:serine/threonine-protein kinase
MGSLQWLDAKGNLQALAAKPEGFLQPRLSPDGKLIATSIAGPNGQDIWVYDWQRDTRSAVTFGGNVFSFPVWSPDGRFLVFQGRGGMFWTRADGGTKPQPLTETKDGQFPWSFSPDGKHLAYAEFAAGAGDIWTVPIETTAGGLKAGKPEPFLQTATNELFPAFSPDGRWIAYRTYESGTNEIQVRPFPDTGGKWLISNNGGVVPVWSPNGRELFYRTEDQRIMVVAYTVKGDVFVADKPRLWSDKRLVDVSQRNLDIAPDGSRFLVSMPVDAPEAQKSLTHVIFLENFGDELRRRLHSPK